MKKLALISISFYQVIFSPLLKHVIGVRAICRFTPSCSQYAKIAIVKYGLIKGIKMALIRLLHCQPFSMSTRVPHLSEVQGMAEERSKTYKNVRRRAPEDMTQQFAK